MICKAFSGSKICFDDTLRFNMAAHTILANAACFWQQDILVEVCYLKNFLTIPFWQPSASRVRRMCVQENLECIFTQCAGSIQSAKADSRAVVKWYCFFGNHRSFTDCHICACKKQNKTWLLIRNKL